MQTHYIRDGVFVPIPGRHTPFVDTPAWQVRDRAPFIKGFVDLVVEHEGRVYFADWKSDVLSSYEPDQIAMHVGAHYDTQVKLYSLAR